MPEAEGEECLAEELLSRLAERWGAGEIKAEILKRKVKAVVKFGSPQAAEGFVFDLLRVYAGGGKLSASVWLADGSRPSTVLVYLPRDLRVEDLDPIELEGMGFEV